MLNIKAWWDNDVDWMPKLIREKYASYVNGYEVESGAAKAINAYIICADETLIGCIQIYNAYDFFAQSR